MRENSFFYIPEDFSPEEFFNRIIDDYVNFNKKYLWQQEHHILADIFPKSSSIRGMYLNPVIEGYCVFELNSYDKLLIYSRNEIVISGSLAIAGFGKKRDSCKKELEKIAGIKLRKLTKKEIEIKDLDYYSY
ncbi:MAG: hypothetical protein WC867_00625 [Candidatus Pacearchaeota archaeon]|jgi:hypothetical protein